MAVRRIDDKKSVKIGVLGTHGVGKTTLALDLGQLIQKTGKFSVSVLTELARECPYPMGVNQAEEATNWLIARQISRELELSRNASLLVCDRTSLDALIYTEASHQASKRSIDEQTPLLYNAAHDWLESYDVLIWIRPSDMLIDDGFRMIDHGFRNQVDALFKQHIRDYQKSSAESVWLEEVSQEDIMEPKKRQEFFVKFLQQIDKFIEKKPAHEMCEKELARV